MELKTRLDHLSSESEFNKSLAENMNLVVCCGRMGPMCIPVYHAMEELRDRYPHVRFMDMLFDLPDARVIKDLPECSGFMGLPFTVYLKNGKVVEATTSIQTKENISGILDRVF